MTLELFELVDDEGKLLPRIKDKLIESFCESTVGDCWFLELYMYVISFSLI